MRIVLVIAVLALFGCKEAASAPPAPPAPAAAAAVARQPVSKVVFLDKENACECTQKAIDASWKALQAALAGATLPVERIHLDSQAAFAAGYLQQRALVAVPGVYFLAEGGQLIELLQGEVTEAQVKKVLEAG